MFVMEYIFFLFQDIVEPFCNIEVDGQVTGITTIGVCTYIVYCKDDTIDFDRNWKVYKKYKNLLEIIQKKRGKVSQVWWIVG